MSTKKLLLLIASPIDKIEVYELNTKKLMYTVDIADFEKHSDIKLQFFDIYQKEDLSVLEVFI